MHVLHVICSDLCNGILFSTCFILLEMCLQLLSCVLGNLMKFDCGFWWLEWMVVGWNGRSCRLIFVQERRGYKEKWWRKERKGNSFRNVVLQWVGQPSVKGRLADRPIDRWPSHLGSVSRMLHLTEFGVSVGRQVAEYPRFRIQNAVFLTWWDGQLLVSTRLTDISVSANRLPTDRWPTIPSFLKWRERWGFQFQFFLDSS